MGTELETRPGVPAPVPTPSVNPLPASLGGGQPFAGNSASREVMKPAGGGVAYSLSEESWLDMISQLMHQLNDDLDKIGEKLEVLERTAEVMQMTVGNVDQLSQIVQAPAATRSALDADAQVCETISDLVRQTRAHAYNTQLSNAQSFLGLANMRAVQDRQRGMGAGPKLLNTAGRVA